MFPFSFSFITYTSPVKTGDLNFIVDFGMNGFVYLRILASERKSTLSDLAQTVLFDFELYDEKTAIFFSSSTECSPVVST